jgi:hypothetical protein
MMAQEGQVAEEEDVYSFPFSAFIKRKFLVCVNVLRSYDFLWCFLGGVLGFCGIV